uniref:Tyrosine-protein phosphatase domain-containing protein n=1 Tax=Steinernema glaseri TaxID=37863 RepID=A0A1I7ZLU8_9BILA
MNSEQKTNLVEDPCAHQDVVRSLVKRFCDTTLKKGISGLREEFARLKDEAVPSADSLVAFHAHHKAMRNRYRDIPCVEESRVKLVEHPAELDYIHANFVSTPFHERRFICTQAPISTTCYDFWWMVLQEKSDVIVMLCNFYEDGRPKCARYVPMEEQASITFRDITITATS